jgi:DeoR/GlpR family transcriptional regulator of sugar metabolism
MLSHVSDTLRERRRASVIELARSVESTPDAVKGMLALLERKGRVRRLPGGACGGCGKCDASDLEVYEWAGD